MIGLKNIEALTRTGRAAGTGRRAYLNSLTLIVPALLCGLCALFPFIAQPVRAQNLSFEELEKLPSSPADHRLAYGDDPLQFGDLRLPRGKGPHPVVIVIHGGCWYSQYDLNHIAAFSTALARMGLATWSLEYRRIGNAGGGWPGTFQDVARGTDFLRVLSRSYPLDLRRVFVIGHSAGGQLALWLAARSHLPENSPLSSPDPLPVQGVISLAGINDLRGYGPGCGNAVSKLLGGSPEEVPDRYRQTSPVELLPLRVRQRLIHGLQDQIVPISQSKDYEAAAKRKSDDVSLIIVKEAGHFDLIAPQAPAWTAIQGAIRELLKPGGPK